MKRIASFREPRLPLIERIKERESQLLSVPWTPDASLELDQLIVVMEQLGIAWVRGG